MIKSQDSSVQVEFLEIDLASLKSVREAAHKILTRETVVDILVCNAGVVAQQIELTEDGIEMDFQINYLGITPAEN